MISSQRRSSLGSLSDAELIAETRRLVEHERHAMADVIAILMEVDRRRLYLGEGCSSLFTYCTQVLHLSEHAAYGRIEAARAARRFPCIIELLADGELTLTAVGLLAPHLTPENYGDVLVSARHKSKREVEALVASLRPLPPVPSKIRRLPVAAPFAPCPSVPGPTAACDPVTKTTIASCTPPPKAAVVMPLAPARFKVQVTISEQAHQNLRRAQELLRHVVPNGDPAAIVERGLALLVADLERTRLAATKRPRPAGANHSRSRHVPASVKREVWARDGGQCAFVGTAGRCRERGFLELHHLVPFADGGATDLANLQLRCRAHNGYEAEHWFGPMWRHSSDYEQ